MGVVTTKSAAITNRDATPRVLNNGRVTGARLHRAAGLVAVANGNSTGSIYIFCSIPSNAIVSDVKVTSADIGTTTTADFGIYQTTANGGAVVDADHFGSAVSLKDGAIAKSSVVHESTVYPYTAIEKPLWEALGLSADTNRMYDVCATLTGDADAAGTILVEVEYTT